MSRTEGMLLNFRCACPGEQSGTRDRTLVQLIQYETHNFTLLMSIPVKHPALLLNLSLY